MNLQSHSRSIISGGKSCIRSPTASGAHLRRGSSFYLRGLSRTTATSSYGRPHLLARMSTEGYEQPVCDRVARRAQHAYYETFTLGGHPRQRTVALTASAPMAARRRAAMSVLIPVKARVERVSKGPPPPYRLQFCGERGQSVTQMQCDDDPTDVNGCMRQGACT
jgi:hypothetical protein